MALATRFFAPTKSFVEKSDTVIHMGISWPWNRPETVKPVAKVADHELETLRREVRDLRMEMVKVSDNVYRWMKRVQTREQREQERTDSVQGSGDNPGAAAPSRALREVAIRRGGYGLHPDVSSDGSGAG